MKTIKDLLGTPESIRLDGRKKEFREKLKKLAYEKAKKEADAGSPIDEISAKLAGRYIKKRTHRDIPYAGQQMGSQHKQRRHQGVKDFVKHTKSVDMAVDKLTKNKDKIKVPATEANVNEISKGKVADYIKKRSLDTMPDAGYRMNDPHSSERRRKGTRDYVKGVKNIPTAVNKLTGKAMVPATEANMSDLSYDADIHSNGSMKVKKMGKDIHLHGKSYHSSDDHAKVAKKMGMKISSHGKTMGGTRSTLTKDLQSEDKTTDAERAAIDAFMKKKGAKQLPPGKAQGHHGKSFSIKPMGISPKKMGVSSPSRLDKDMVHKEDKAYGPTGIAYSVPKGHPDAVDPKTGKKKYPPHLALDKMRAAFAPTKGGKDAKEDTVASVAKDLEKVTKKDKKESFKSFMKSGKE